MKSTRVIVTALALLALPGVLNGQRYVRQTEAIDYVLTVAVSSVPAAFTAFR